MSLFDPSPRRAVFEAPLREPDPKTEAQMLAETRWERALGEDLSREQWLRQGAPKPRPIYDLPDKACWACGVRGHKRGSPDCRRPGAVVCFGSGEPGKTKATCPNCSELWESDEVLAGRRKPKPGQYVIRRPEIVSAHQRMIHRAGWRNGVSGHSTKKY